MKTNTTIIFSVLFLLSQRSLAQSYNTATGSLALNSITNGDANTATGYQGLYSNTGYWNNTAHGAWALVYCNGGEYNTALGSNAMFYTYSGSYNTALGYKSLFNNSTGNYNTVSGRYAGYNNNANNNTGIGETSLYTTSSGAENAAIGDGAGWINATGNYNTYIGYNTDNTVTNTNYDNTTVISARTYISGANNKILAGNLNYAFTIGGTVAWTNFSDRRIKKQVMENIPGLSFIKELQPVTYQFDSVAYKTLVSCGGKDDSLSARTSLHEIFPDALQTGFIAQNVEAVSKKIGYVFSGVEVPTDPKGIYGLRYEEFVVPLVKALQEISIKNDDLRHKIMQLTALRDELRNKIDGAKKMVISH